MKLSNQQIEAIISTIDNKDCAEFKKQEAAFVKKQDEKNAAQAKKIYDAIKAMPERLDIRVGYTSEPTLKHVLQGLRNEVFTGMKRLDTSDLKNKIVLASIDATDMAHLEKILGIKLT